MKKLIPLFILSLCFSAFGQTETILQDKIKTYKNKRLFNLDYDESRNQTSVRFSSLPLKSADPNSKNLDLGIAFNFDGRKPKTDIEQYEIFCNVTGDPWFFSFRRDLVLTMDGEELTLTKGKVGDRIEPGGEVGGSYQFISFYITRDELQQLADSRKIKLKLAYLEFKLNDGHKQMFRDMLDLGKAN